MKNNVAVYCIGLTAVLEYGADDASCFHGNKVFKRRLPWERRNPQGASSKTAALGNVTKEILITSVASPFPCAISLGRKASPAEITC